MTLDTNFVSVSEHPVSENTTFEHFVSVQNSDSVHSVHSEYMAQPPTPPGLRKRTLRELVAPDFTYDSQDPYKHLKEFHIVCSTMKLHDVMEDHESVHVKRNTLESSLYVSWF
ncbi:hypothetical protein Lal_00035497 [Lupinus albus]|nr:hypothetical protein Lal_00035497 [Lupinus albus]